MVTWATVDDVSSALGFDPSGVGPTPLDAPRLAQVTAAANTWAYERRQASGYTADDPDVVPSPRVLEGVVLYACRLYRERGMYGGSAGFDGAELPNPVGSTADVLRLLGIPRPVAV